MGSIVLWPVMVLPETHQGASPAAAMRRLRRPPLTSLLGNCDSRCNGPVVDKTEIACAKRNTKCQARADSNIWKKNHIFDNVYFYLSVLITGPFVSPCIFNTLGTVAVRGTRPDVPFHL